jgi:hypothetical protein
VLCIPAVDSVPLIDRKHKETSKPEDGMERMVGRRDFRTGMEVILAGSLWVEKGYRNCRNILKW